MPPGPRVLSRSFNGGELSPVMGGNIGDAKYQSGAARLQNFLVLPQGPVTRRPGLDFVSFVKDSTKTVRLLPFIHSIGQAFAIEMGAEVTVDGRDIGYFRFHTGGATLLYGTPADCVAPRSFTSVAIDTDTIDFGAAHGMTTGDPIAFSGAGVLPAPLVAGRTYYVIVVSANVIKVAYTAAQAVNGTQIDLTTAGSGAREMRFARANRDYVTPISIYRALGTSSATTATTMSVASPTFTAGALVGFWAIVGSSTGRITANTTTQITVAAWTGGTPPNVSSYEIDGVDVVNNTITFAAGHGLVVQDPIVFTAAPAGTVPGGLTAGTIYYAIVVSATVIKVAATAAAALVPTPIALTVLAGGTGDCKFHYAYEPGDLAYWFGVGLGTFYCRKEPWHDHTDHPPTDTDYWVREPSNGIYEVPHVYLQSQLFALQYDQSGDVLALGHPDVGVTELRRYGATDWVLTDVSFAAPAAPTNVGGSGTGGKSLTLTAIANTGTTNLYTTNQAHGFVAGVTIVRITGCSVSSNNGTFVVRTVPASPSTAAGPTTFDCQLLGGGAAQATITETPGGGTRVRDLGSGSELDTNTYVVTALDAEGHESAPSASTTIENNLSVDGAYNDVTWNAVAGAARYRVYKQQTGLYGFIGETETLTFRDNNIGPDLSVTPPRFDTSLTDSGGAPSVLGRFEGRRVFARSDNEPQGCWLTKAGTETDMSYHLPVQDDDRISFVVSSRQLAEIRHAIDLGRLVLLTSSGEVVIRPLNTDALTPSSVSARFDTYVGASRVQPILTEGAIVFAADRGGHVREASFDVRGRLDTADLSVRSGHLFDPFTIVQMAHTKAPQQVLWFLSSNGRLVALAYVPAEQVAAWSWIETAGTIESVTAIPDGTEDRVYVVVNRFINGANFRYVERLCARADAAREDSRFLDCMASFDGTNTTSVRVSMTNGKGDTIGWKKGDQVTIDVDSPGIFDASLTPSTDVGDELRITAADGTVVRVQIVSVTNVQEAIGTLLTDVPASLQAMGGIPVATAAWAWARNTISGFDHLEGTTIPLLADGVVLAPQLVTGGIVTLAMPAVKVQGGLGYRTEFWPLPAVLQVDGLGQGKAKNVMEAWLRVQNSARFRIGSLPEDQTQSPATSALGLTLGFKDNGLFSGEVPVNVAGDWQRTGQILVRMEDPLPLTLVAMTMRVALGDN